MSALPPCVDCGQPASHQRWNTWRCTRCHDQHLRELVAAHDEGRCVGCCGRSVKP